MNNTVLSRYEELAQHAHTQWQQSGRNDKIIIQVGSATCENAAGATEVGREFERNIQASGRDDIILHQVGCTGRCSREPIVGVLMPGRMPVKYQRVTRDSAHQIFSRHIQGGEPVAELTLDQTMPRLKRQVILCEARHCGTRGDEDIFTVFQDEINRAGLDPEEIREAASAWISEQTDSDREEALLKLEMVDDAYQRLLKEDARELLDTAGCADTEIFWGSEPVEPVEAIMQAAGLRKD